MSINLINTTINFLFPAKCLLCGTFHNSCICNKCLDTCQLVEETLCINCNQKTNLFKTHSKCLLKGCNAKILPTHFYYCYEYTGTVRRCIKMSKYSGKQFALLQQLTEHGIQQLHQQINLKDFLAVPIPLHPKKLKTRGFNQVDIISAVVASHFGLPINKTLLIRTRNTQAQYHLSKTARAKNLENAFAVKMPSTIVKSQVPQKILLIDDISTSGATFLEATATLYKSGAKEVRAFALTKKI